jgi:ketol-acid reductoisomerase
MQKLLDEIKDGSFARNWIHENQTGRAEFNRIRAVEQDHPIEKVGAKLRSMMPFLDPVTIKPGQQG